MDNLLYFYYFIMGRMRRLYFMAIPENKQEFKKSRIFFTIDGATAQAILQLSGGTFLAALITTLGINDSLNGIISSFAILACAFQPVATLLTKNLKKFKLFVCFSAITHRLVFSFIFFIPFLKTDNNIKINIFILCFFMAHLFLQIGVPAAQDWIASLVPQKLRGKYLALRDLIGVLAFAAITLIAGIILDYYKNNGSITGGFFIIGCIVFILALINIIALSNIKEPKLSHTNNNGKELHGRLTKNIKTDVKESFMDDLKSVYFNKVFRKVILLNIMWQFVLFATTPYNAIYQIKELNLPYTFIMTCAMAGNLLRIAVTPFWGRLGDKYGMAYILKYAMGIMGIFYMAMVFTIPQNAFFMFPVALVFSGLAWGFIGIGILGVHLDYLPSDKRISYLSISSGISGICGFLASIAGGVLLRLFQNLKPVIFGREIYSQQIINLIGFVIIVVIMLYIHFSIQKEVKVINQTDGVIAGIK